MSDRVHVTDEHAEAVCKMGRGQETCSFLGVGPGGMCCLKGSSLEALINQKRGKGEMRAMGDNCAGPPHFTTKGC